MEKINKAGVVRNRKKAMIKLSELTKNYILQSHLDETDFVATIGITNDETEIAPFTKIIQKSLPNLPLLQPFSDWCNHCNTYRTYDTGYLYCKKI